MPKYNDQTGNTIELKDKPRRIVSLVPSQSELLWELGLKDELVGITKFCIHPEEMYRNVRGVGGTKKLNIKMIEGLKPDLIIGNKEENDKEQIIELQKKFPVWMSDITDLDQANEMIRQLGQICGKEKEAKDILDSIKDSLSQCKNIFSAQKVAYFIWYRPWMLAGGDTFINSVLMHTGFSNLVENISRYPELDDEQLRELQPAYCLLSSEPFPFKEKHIQELQRLLPESRIVLVNGEMFSWYGSRMQLMGNYMRQLKAEFGIL